jgi:predicted nuclease of predicted toxin-antitoxin system
VSLKLLIDMNLSPAWVAALSKQGWQATHWSSVGDPRASDREIMSWAQANQHTVFTHDLDFGMLLAVTRAEGPSVIQVRAQDVTPAHLENLVISALQEYGPLLERGALIVVDESKLRVRILPLNE